MKISVNWIKEFSDIKGSVDELVTKIGAQLGEVEEVVNLGERYQGIVVAKIVACDPHPNADKLHVCKIDDGKATKGVKRDERGLVQVVCGAPNVRVGLSVAWLPPGTIVPSTFDKEQFKLEVRPLRGVESNGMLASGRELAINDNHQGILVLDKHAEPGTPFADVYQLNDTVIDIENKMFTHRPDLFGMLGVAREIAGIQHLQFKSPDWYMKELDAFKVKGEPLKLIVKNELPALVPRFMMVPISGVNIKPSPIAMQSFLSRVGVKPINNIVDITNFVMVLTAQPLHAFDYDKVVAQDNAKYASIVVRHPKKGEKLALLGGKTIEPRSEAIMIATNDRLIAMGGVMGGADTEVDKDTRNIIIECATFDMFNIRKTSMEHGLFTDAVTRFNKGQSPLQNDNVLAYAIAWVQKIANGQVAGPVHDLTTKSPALTTVNVEPDFINSRLGVNLTATQITKLLDNVEFDTVKKDDTLDIMVPFWRTDIEIAEDVVEEVGRLHGYDNLPLELPTRTLEPVEKNQLLEFKSLLRNILASAGANELLTYSFIHGNLLDKVGQDRELAYQLNNALSPELQYYRLSLTPCLLDKVHPNIKAGHDNIALFEINKTHDKTNTHEDMLPIEEERVALVFAAGPKSAKKMPGAPYFQAKHYAQHLLMKLGFSEIVFQPATSHSPKTPTSKQALAPFDVERTAYIKCDGKLVGLVGEYSETTRSNLKLPDYCAGFELDILMLQEYSNSLAYKPLSRYPSADQDISFKVSPEVNYSKLYEFVDNQLAEASEDHRYQCKISPVDIYQDQDAKNKHITLRITINHAEKTLTTEEVNKLLDNVAKNAKTKLGAIRL